jgi:hypothetical protein
VLAENLIRADKAACRYWWRMPVGCQNSGGASELGFYPRPSRSSASYTSPCPARSHGLRCSPVAMPRKTWRSWRCGTRSRYYGARLLPVLGNLITSMCGPIEAPGQDWWPSLWNPTSTVAPADDLSNASAAAPAVEIRTSPDQYHPGHQDRDLADPQPRPGRRRPPRPSRPDRDPLLLRPAGPASRPRRSRPASPRQPSRPHRLTHGRRVRNRSYVNGRRADRNRTRRMPAREDRGSLTSRGRRSRGRRP